MHINLLPAAFRRRMLLRQSLRWWSLRWGACLVVGAAYLLVEWRQLALARAAREEVESRCAPIRRIVEQTTRVEAELNAVSGDHAELRRLQPNRRPLAVLALLSQATGPLQGRLRLERLDFHQAPDLPAESGGSTPAPAADSAKTRLILAGIAVDDAAVAAFIETLRGCKVVRNVELLSSTAWEPAGLSGRRFEIVCSF
jgi:hypothetical protein